ncbi:hypothetical protein [Frankia gtarii]|uniref:hypothetical protein n=1 Tax=Frankia gtarii TaxID=2950102 RepID=UPI0021C0D0FD|nr:hypothetical protein [Frankia gtarii]
MIPAHGWAARFNAQRGDGNPYRTTERVIAWDDDGQALVVDKAAGKLVLAAQIDGFTGIDVDDHLVSALPGGGWMGEFRGAGGTTHHEPVIGWTVLAPGLGGPLFCDDQGLFDPDPIPELIRVWHPRATGPLAPPAGSGPDADSPTPPEDGPKS